MYYSCQKVVFRKIISVYAQFSTVKFAILPVFTFPRQNLCKALKVSTT